MSDLVADRIERALKRIEVAAAAQSQVRTKLETRNATLRTRIESALVDLDALIARERELEAQLAGDEENAADEEQG
ncbi:hypothetical protein SAMN03159338_3240 [Sphingomonas sp. NFR04]|uniref:hypothetical protein n=1 Tax=Sphingomonas sp. NFR04 TaxID=1566283 RepID=UPI0008E915C4|nr:hypothetical protein [Sphingomonas sp. NFR04]SFK10865.1 hypothetical protein SAMN03159338_3240 [Sphingomonas sp. NFR04]